MAALPVPAYRPPPLPPLPPPVPGRPTGLPPPLWPLLPPDQRRLVACLLADLLRRCLTRPLPEGRTSHE
jgi:hypothetical protein